MIPEKIKEQALKMWLEDYPTYLIALELKISTTSIYKWAKQRNIKKKIIKKYGGENKK